MSLEPKEREDKFTESSSSSSSSMDEKDLDQNGYVDVQDLIKASAEQQQSTNEQPQQEDNAKISDVDAISQLIANQFNEIKSTVEDDVKLEHVVLQEPDSTTTNDVATNESLQNELTNIITKIKDQEIQQPEQQQQQEQQKPKEVVAEVIVPKPAAPTPTPTPAQTPASTCQCSFKAWCKCLLELIYFHPKVDDILTWKDPKISGALLAILLISLISFATFSLLSIVGFVLLSAMSIVGSYRLYLVILQKIKGQSDDTINKFISMKVSIPKESIQHVAQLTETFGNEYLNKLKQIVLWENLNLSAISYIVAYIIYSLGCSLNAITLLILFVIFAFTWPKVYKMYQVQIDQAVKKAHDQINDVLAKIKEKLPFLNKKKLQ